MEQIILLVLIGILAVEGGILCYCQLKKPVSIRQEPVKTVPSVEILRGRPGAWRHHSWRPEGHPDIDEAYCTAGLAWRDVDGKVHEGLQDE